jgi:UDP-N-acetylglucosamine transferase subunit ALG13
MILVTVGATYYPFDRLLAAVEELDEPDVLVQHGASTTRPANARCVEFMSFDDIVAQIHAARVVVTHAGTGSVLVTLANGKHPIVVPRRRAFGEAIDDHQVDFARALAPSGLITLVEEPRELADAVARTGSAIGTGPKITLDGPLARELGGYLRGVAGVRARAR